MGKETDEIKVKITAALVIIDLEEIAAKIEEADPMDTGEYGHGYSEAISKAAAIVRAAAGKS